MAHLLFHLHSLVNSCSLFCPLATAVWITVFLLTFIKPSSLWLVSCYRFLVGSRPLGLSGKGIGKQLETSVSKSWSTYPEKDLGVRGEFKKNDLERAFDPPVRSHTPGLSPVGGGQWSQTVGEFSQGYQGVYRWKRETLLKYAQNTHGFSSVTSKGPHHHYNYWSLHFNRIRSLHQSREAIFLEKIPAMVARMSAALVLFPSTLAIREGMVQRGKLWEIYFLSTYEPSWELPSNWDKTSLGIREVAVRCQWRCKPENFEFPDGSHSAPTGWEGLRRGTVRRVHPRRKASQVCLQQCPQSEG